MDQKNFRYCVTVCVQLYAIGSKPDFSWHDRTKSLCIWRCLVNLATSLLRNLHYYTINCSEGQGLVSCEVLRHFEREPRRCIFALRFSKDFIWFLAGGSFSFHYSQDNTNVTSFSLMRPRSRLIPFTLNLSLNAVHFLFFFFFLSTFFFSPPPEFSLLPSADRTISLHIPRDRNTGRESSLHRTIQPRLRLIWECHERLPFFLLVYARPKFLWQKPPIYVQLITRGWR